MCFRLLLLNILWGLLGLLELLLRYLLLKLLLGHLLELRLLSLGWALLKLGLALLILSGIYSWRRSVLSVYQQ